MGGFGSSRWVHHNKKRTVDSSIILPVSSLKPGIEAGVGYTAPIEVPVAGTFGKAALVYTIEASRIGLAARLTYTITDGHNGARSDCDYIVTLESTPQPYGGSRWWFLCPVSKYGQPCGRRAAKLYLPPGSRYFGCRTCHQLTYRSCQQQHSLQGQLNSVARLLNEHQNDWTR